MFGVTKPSKPHRKGGRRISGHPAGYPRGTVGTGGECWLGLRHPSPAPPAAENGLWIPRGGCHGILKGWGALGPDIEKVALGDGSSLRGYGSRPAPPGRERYPKYSAMPLLQLCYPAPLSAVRARLRTQALASRYPRLFGRDCRRLATLRRRQQLAYFLRSLESELLQLLQITGEPC